MVHSANPVNSDASRNAVPQLKCIVSDTSSLVTVQRIANAPDCNQVSPVRNLPGDV